MTGFIERLLNGMGANAVSFGAGIQSQGGTDDESMMVAVPGKDASPCATLPDTSRTFAVSL